MVGTKTLVDVTIRWPSDDWNHQRPTAFTLIPWNSFDGRQRHKQHHDNELQSRASRDDVLIKLDASEIDDKVCGGVRPSSAENNKLDENFIWQRWRKIPLN